MTSTRTVLLCIVFVVIQACAEENKVVKQVQFNRNMPAWRSSVRVRQVFKHREPRIICPDGITSQVQGSFPRLSLFYDGGSRPRLFNFNKRYEDLYDNLER
ncbi:hypothetical protein Y032_0238g3300 [Ancylostoma ceylanicum]|nr:hypothetical protein Y032_0238g3300 [Ancylostoma ceylanicum]